MRVTKILGFDISFQSASQVVKVALSGAKRQLVINTMNPHSYAEQKSDDQFSEALLESDVLIPDGSGIVMAAKFLNCDNITKIAGYDLFLATMFQLNMVNGKVFFLGSTDRVLDKIMAKSKIDYPNVEVFTFSPPFKNNFDWGDIKSFSNKIEACNPDVVFVGLTAPKQEKLIHLLKGVVNVKFLSGIGAAFDFYAGTVKRPSRLWLVLHLEWLSRFLGEPKRLWRRNFVSTPIFIFDVVKEKIKMVAQKYKGH